MNTKHRIVLKTYHGELELDSFVTEGENLSHELANKILTDWCELSEGDTIVITRK